jgi:hypothetical protein
MNMVGHHDVGVYAAVVMLGGLPEIAEITMMVVITEEARLTVIAALDDVHGNARQTEAGFAGDWSILPVENRTPMTV